MAIAIEISLVKTLELQGMRDKECFCSDSTMWPVHSEATQSVWDVEYGSMVPIELSQER